MSNFVLGIMSVCAASVWCTMMTMWYMCVFAACSILPTVATQSWLSTKDARSTGAGFKKEEVDPKEKKAQVSDVQDKTINIQCLVQTKMNGSFLHLQFIMRSTFKVDQNL